MGSVISLSVGNLEIDWAKNWLGRDHGKLFGHSDRVKVPYHYVDDDGEPIVEWREALSRPLKTCQRRLGMLGYTLPGVQTLYEDALREAPEEIRGRSIDFQDFKSALACVDVAECIPADKEESAVADFDPGEFVSRAIFSAPGFNKVIKLAGMDRDVGMFFENLDPYCQLRLLLENPANDTAEVTWRYVDVLEGGWVSEDDVEPRLSEEDRFLVVTEGKSDKDILQKSLSLVAPDIADFFYFVDMDNYPFTGTGNVLRFCQGLAKIRIQNKVLIVLDNDAAGVETFSRLESMGLPQNIHLSRLPDLQECSSFLTEGPSGQTKDDLNGRAVSIEMFLDLPRTNPEPMVRWTSYQKELDRYQGELINKDDYTQAFLKERNLQTYNLSKLRLLWDHLYKTCTGESATSTDQRFS